MPSSRVARYLPSFRRDLRDILLHSEADFGLSGAERYSRLIAQALKDLLDDPLRPGTMMRADIVSNARTYHLSFSRDRVPGARVKDPRHFVLYRYTPERLDFARLLHERRNTPDHLPVSFRV